MRHLTHIDTEHISLKQAHQAYNTELLPTFSGIHTGTVLLVHYTHLVYVRQPSRYVKICAFPTILLQSCGDLAHGSVVSCTSRCLPF